MPLDSTDFVVETKPDLSKPSLEGLSYALRHLPETLGRWKYIHTIIENDCGTAGCAWGMARRLWPKQTRAKRKNVCSDDADHLFGSGAYDRFFTEGAYGILPELVTPQMVADRIDAYLAETRK